MRQGTSTCKKGSESTQMFISFFQISWYQTTFVDDVWTLSPVIPLCLEIFKNFLVIVDMSMF